MLHKFSFLVWVMLAAAGAYGVYVMKYHVEEVRQENEMLEAELQQQKNALALRNLEWAALNHPARLRRLSSALLPMEPMSADRVVEVSVLPMMGQDFATNEGGVR